MDMEHLLYDPAEMPRNKEKYITRKKKNDWGKNIRYGAHQAHRTCLKLSLQENCMESTIYIFMYNND